MIIYLSIKNSITALLKELYPTFDIFYEEISKTQDKNVLELTDYFFVDIIPVENTTLSEYHTLRSMVIDIAGHTKAETNQEYLIMADAIDKIIRPVFQFEDRAITINRANHKIVDKVLHYTFDLVFTDTVEAPEPPPLMEELDITIKEGM